MARSMNTQFAVAVHVLTYLAGQDPARPVSSEELSRSTRANPVYVRRVLGPLRDDGLVRSRPGAHGGWELTTAPDKITLAQVWRLLQGSDPILGIHGPDPACAVGRSVDRALVMIDQAVGDAVDSQLEKFSVQDILTQNIGALAVPRPTDLGPAATR